MDNQTNQLKYLEEEIENQRNTLANFEEDSSSFIRNMREDDITLRICQACEGEDVTTLISRLDQENEDYKKDCIKKIDRKREEMLEEIHNKTRDLEMIKAQKRDED